MVFLDLSFFLVFLRLGRRPAEQRLFYSTRSRHLLYTCVCVYNCLIYRDSLCDVYLSSNKMKKKMD